MAQKRMVVLANSIKRGGRCVAGREVHAESGAIGDWLRPISDVDGGALMPRHLATHTGRRLGVLDIVDVPLGGNADDPCHPEDWALGGQKWRHVGRFESKHLPGIEETPDDLWLEDPLKTDTVTCRFLQSRAWPQSLYLIRPENLRIRLWQECNRQTGAVQKKSRAVFAYRNVEYDLGLTDPIITLRLFATFPPAGQPPKEYTMPFPDKCLACVSLTPMFMGCHYKVVAAVLETP